MSISVPSWLESRPHPSIIYGTAAAWLTLHLLIWGYSAIAYDMPVAVLLNYWDAGLYTRIVQSGYGEELWAFYPAYPFAVRWISHTVGATNIPLAGALLSTLAFGAFVALVARASARADPRAGLAPQTLMGWLFFLFSPGSYIFHSHHTEAIFLLLSFLAFHLSANGRSVSGGLAAALSALTRNQGVFVVATTALLAAGARKKRGVRVRAFLIAGATGSLGIIVFLLFQLAASGSALSFMDAQRNWIHADSALTAVRTLYLGNPWQTSDSEVGMLLRYAFFWFMIGGTALLWRRQRALAAYGAMSLLVHLGQGSLWNVFRYNAVVFPVLFNLGDALTRLPHWLKAAILLGWIGLNLYITRHYAVSVWAY